MKELVEAMTDKTPEKRPTIEEVVEKFDRIRDSLSAIIKLRTPTSITPKMATFYSPCSNIPCNCLVQLYITHRRPAFIHNRSLPVPIIIITTWGDISKKKCTEVLRAVPRDLGIWGYATPNSSRKTQTWRSPSEIGRTF